MYILSLCYISILYFFLIGLSFLCCNHAAAEEQSIYDRYIALALQGDLSHAASLFADPTVKQGPPFEQELSQLFQLRFMERTESLSPDTGDPLVNSIVSAYRQYWTQALMGDVTPAQAVQNLDASLSAILAAANGAGTTNDGTDIYQRMGHVLNRKGYGFLETSAPPLRDLFLWKNEEIRKYSVRLADRTEHVNVVFMTEMSSLGWKEYATLGLMSTTGWVENGQLYCVGWAYDRSSESFQVSYLKHESRHLADFDDFPGLDSSQLEYRAKLTELSFASKTLHSLLHDFTQKSAMSPESPHALANFQVTRNLYRELYGEPFPESGDPWTNLSVHRVNRTARSMLQKDSEILEANRP